MDFGPLCMDDEAPLRYLRGLIPYYVCNSRRAHFSESVYLEICTTIKNTLDTKTNCVDNAQLNGAPVHLSEIPLLFEDHSATPVGETSTAFSPGKAAE